MAYLLQDMNHWYRDLMDNQSDPRVKDWFLMQSPLPTLAICISYAYISKSLAPRIMEDRKPFGLRSILIYYNLLQTILSTYIFIEYLLSGWWGEYSFRCQPVDYTSKGMRMAVVSYIYFLSKFTEFFDTLFFLLRKKNNQVSTLHVIHHGCMPFSVWMGMKFAPGGHSTFFALVNSFVHIVMYFYYMVAAMGPEYKRFIWWKKYLTAFQMIQFVAVLIHQMQLMWIPSCNYPKGFMVWIALHGVMFLFLFSDFYKQAYSKKGDALKNGQAKINNNNNNPGFCMPVMNDDNEHTKEKANQLDAFTAEQYIDSILEKNGSLANGIPSNGTVRSRK